MKIGEPDPQVLATLLKTEGSAGLNEKIKRRTHVVRIFPNAESCLRLVRARSLSRPARKAQGRVFERGFRSLLVVRGLDARIRSRQLRAGRRALPYDRLSGTERAMLLGAACAKAHGWSSKKT